MPFWNLFRKSARNTLLRDTKLNMAACKVYESTLQLTVAARLVLAKPIQPRTNEIVGELLSHVWRDDPIILLLVRAALVCVTDNEHVTLESGEVVKPYIDLLKIASLPAASAADCMEGCFMQMLQAFVRQQTPRCPPSGEARYDALVAGLRACLRHNMHELRQTNEVSLVDTLLACMKFSSTLRAHDLHDVHCEMLTLMPGSIFKDADGSLVNGMVALEREVCSSLCWLAHEKPLLWEMLKDPATSEAFWPVVDAIGTLGISGSGPMLLDALPFLSESGKAHVIAALERIGDASALPALQQLAQDKTSPLAPAAHKAAKMIVRRSRGDVTQLLRAAEARHAPDAGETLLRPAKAAASNVRPEELLRPETAPTAR